MTVSVAVFLFLTAIVILFQMALALGAPWGEYTMGGKFPGVLSSKLRIAAVAQIVVLLLFGAIVLTRSDLALSAIYPFSRVAIWFVAGFFVLGSIANLTTPSKGERLLSHRLGPPYIGRNALTHRSLAIHSTKPNLC